MSLDHKIFLSFLVLSIILIFVVLLAPFVFAHPGRLTKSTGCHQVSRDYKYASGVIAPKGQYHCHRGFGKMKLDGLEVIKSQEEVEKEKKATTK